MQVLLESNLNNRKLKAGRLHLPHVRIVIVKTISKPYAAPKNKRSQRSTQSMCWKRRSRLATLLCVMGVPATVFVAGPLPCVTGGPQLPHSADSCPVASAGASTLCT